MALFGGNTTARKCSAFANLALNEKEERGRKMEDRKKRAIENHKKGYNCAQSVLCAYSDVLGIDEEILFRVAEGFGGGMGMLGTCGAVTGMFMAAGLAKSSGDLTACSSKPETMKVIRQLREAFEAKNQSLICRELKGVDTGKPLRSCDGCIEDGVEIAGKILL